MLHASHHQQVPVCSACRVFMLPQGGIFTAALLLLYITTSVSISTVNLNTIYVGVLVLVYFRESKYTTLKF